MAQGERTARKTVKQDDPRMEQPGLLTRIQRSIWREPWPQSDKERVRLTLNDLILHLHAPRVPKRALQATYSYGLGIIAIVLFGILASTGVLLAFAYTPSPDEAYGSIKTLTSEIWGGALVRNVHHWSGNLLLIVAVLHMLRVFYTAAFHPPREFNWLLGLALLLFVALSNFTGYLMPWDQLAYWATTIATSMLDYIPLVGPSIREFLVGGGDIGEFALRTFFAFHIVVFPPMMVIIISYHIWRVRKDTFSLPRGLDEPPIDRRRIERVTTIPHLFNLEIALALLTLALVIAWSTWVPAPLEEAANPTHPPNPAKAAWYFMGFQELLLHFHPAFVTVVIPGLTALALFLLPYLDSDPRPERDVTGIWFRSRRGRRLAVWNVILGVGLTAALVVIDEYWLDLPALFSTLPTWISNGAIPVGAILLGLLIYDRLLGRRGATRSERNLALFTLLFVAFVTLTLIGVFFRGENMALVLPWNR